MFNILIHRRNKSPDSPLSRRIFSIYDNKLKGVAMKKFEKQKAVTVPLIYVNKKIPFLIFFN